jgi:hypothetical protein
MEEAESDLGQISLGSAGKDTGMWPTPDRRIGRVQEGSRARNGTADLTFLAQAVRSMWPIQR